jgi:hypothetical protein
VLGSLLIGLLVVGVCTAMLYLVLAPVRDIWRGDKRRVPSLPSISVNARSYLAFLAWFVPVFGGLALLGLTWIVGQFVGSKKVLYPLFVTGVALILGGPPLVVLHWFVSAFGRPRFLIPPPYRSERGGLSQARERRRRQRSGQAPTDHLVEILEVRPRTVEDDFEPYVMARCDDPECDWMAFGDATLPGVPGEEQLRVDGG